MKNKKQANDRKKNNFLIFEKRKVEKRHCGVKLNSFQIFQKMEYIGYKILNVGTISLLIKNMLGLVIIANNIMHSYHKLFRYIFCVITRFICINIFKYTSKRIEFHMLIKI